MQTNRKRNGVSCSNKVVPCRVRSSGLTNGSMAAPWNALPHIFSMLSRLESLKGALWLKLWFTPSRKMDTRHSRRFIHPGSTGLRALGTHSYERATDDWNGSFQLEVDEHPWLHCNFSIPDHARGQHPHPSRSMGLEELGAPTSEVPHLACPEMSVLDSWQTTTPWIGCTWRVLALWSYQEPETANHLLINCSFAKDIWWNSLSWLGCPCAFTRPMMLH